MAEPVYEATVNTKEEQSYLGKDTNLCCESCVIVKEQLQQVFQELKSARTIIALLQQDIIKSKASTTNNMTQSSKFREPSVHDQVNTNWIPVIHNGSKKTKKLVVPEKKQNRQLITLSNKFTSLSDIQELTVPRERITQREV